MTFIPRQTALQSVFLAATLSAVYMVVRPHAVQIADTAVMVSSGYMKNLQDYLWLDDHSVLLLYGTSSSLTEARVLDARYGRQIANPSLTKALVRQGVVRIGHLSPN